MEQVVVSRITSSSPKYPQVWELREEILRKPLGMSLRDEDLSLDHLADMIIAESDGKVIACLLLQPLPDGAVQLRQMAVYEEWQGKGVGRKLVEEAERYCWQKGYHKIILHARRVALGFYRSMDYNIIGDEFTEVGIPHFNMEKNNPMPGADN